MRNSYIGVNDQAKKIKDIYVGVDGIARKVVKAYIGVDGIAKLWWSDETVGYVIFENGVFNYVPDGFDIDNYVENNDDVSNLNEYYLTENLLWVHDTNIVIPWSVINLNIDSQYDNFEDQFSLNAIYIPIKRIKNAKTLKIIARGSLLINTYYVNNRNILESYNIAQSIYNDDFIEYNIDISSNLSTDYILISSDTTPSHSIIPRPIIGTGLTVSFTNSEYTTDIFSSPMNIGEDEVHINEENIGKSDDYFHAIVTSSSSPVYIIIGEAYKNNMSYLQGVLFVSENAFTYDYDYVLSGGYLGSGSLNGRWWAVNGVTYYISGWTSTNFKYIKSNFLSNITSETLYESDSLWNYLIRDGIPQGAGTSGKGYEFWKIANSVFTGTIEGGDSGDVMTTLQQIKRIEIVGGTPEIWPDYIPLISSKIIIQLPSQNRKNIYKIPNNGYGLLIKTKYNQQFFYEAIIIAPKNSLDLNVDVYDLADNYIESFWIGAYDVITHDPDKLDYHALFLKLDFNNDTNLPNGYSYISFNSNYLDKNNGSPNLEANKALVDKLFY